MVPDPRKTLIEDGNRQVTGDGFARDDPPAREARTTREITSPD
ncbi:hypothetical protein Thi970DRAFT_00347 [Thiorhodovibrio frisius]|uniref:Uncharacterized protein n=1 Tax=Thiorhodovibrio frisius TaxID=631362 RepID=H8YW44_9GAMM|nr:hypothetical protein Thi970DRAFT_00347 [Thiorhodovibrio frisius]WPL22981.1 hypothetical protein Thiofri_03161 [Thiorhodovibrio frisius]